MSFEQLFKKAEKKLKDAYGGHLDLAPYAEIELRCWLHEEVRAGRVKKMRLPDYPPYRTEILREVIKEDKRRENDMNKPTLITKIHKHLWGGGASLVLTKEGFIYYHEMSEKLHEKGIINLDEHWIFDYAKYKYRLFGTPKDLEQREIIRQELRKYEAKKKAKVDSDGEQASN